MQIDWSIKVSDILTSVTIIISVVAIIITWTKDRSVRETQQADSVRSAAANMITKLDRWQALYLSLYQELQTEFVIASEKLLEKFDTCQVRDYLWKTIGSKRVQIYSKVLEEQITTSYIDLLAHYPSVRIKFLDMFKLLNETEEDISSSFRVQAQKDVLSCEGKEESYTSAMLGNALRLTAAQYKQKFRNQTSNIISPLREFLFDVITKSNKEILRAR